MNCTKCGQPLEGGALFCKQCGYQHAVNEQKARVNEAAANSKGLLRAQAHSVMFLIFAIAFSAMFASQTISMFQGGFFGILGGILPFIFGLISVIGLWKCYTAKDDASLSRALRSASMIDAYQRVMYTISIVFTTIGVVILFAICAFAGGAIGEATESSDATAGGFVVGLIVLLIGAVAITFISLYRAIYANRRKYFLALSKTAETGEYKEAKAPLFGSWFIGVCTVFSAISAFSSAAMVNMLGDLVGGLMGDMGGEVSGLLDSVFAGLTAGAVMTGISNLVLAAYFIVSALWMSSVHKAEVESHKAIEVEAARLSEIEEATQKAVFEYEAEKRKADDEKARALELERKAAEAEAKKSQAAMQEQQQMMMQMMMQQMMANGMNVPNAAHPEAPAADAPVAEAPAEEAPATQTAE